MDPCSTVIVITPTLGVLATALGSVIGGCIATLFWQALKGRDSHIRYVENVNADLTDINRASVGITGGAIKQVRRQVREG